MKKILILLAACLFVFAACSHGNNPGDGKGVGTYIGTKTPEEAKVVGDIVFNDGSAIPYTDELTLTDAQKAAAIAIIFYKGTDLNSGDDTTTSRTLGVGLKHDEDGLEWCTQKANAYDLNIKTIQCPASGSAGALIFSGDKNGRDNLEQIENFEGVNDTANLFKYPAFYFAKDYHLIVANLGTIYSSGWYLPSLAELFQIYSCRADKQNGVDIDAVSSLCGGDQFASKFCWASSQYVTSRDGACVLCFKDGSWKASEKNCNFSFFACAIREF